MRCDAHDGDQDLPGVLAMPRVVAHADKDDTGLVVSGDQFGKYRVMRFVIKICHNNRSFLTIFQVVRTSRSAPPSPRTGPRSGRRRSKWRISWKAKHDDVKTPQSKKGTIMLPSFPFLDAHSPRRLPIVDGRATYDSRWSLPRTGGKKGCNLELFYDICHIS